MKQNTKKFVWVSLLLLVLSFETPKAQAPLNTRNSNVVLMVSYESEDITVDNTAGGVGFTASKINPTCSPDVINCQAQLASCVVSVAAINILSNPAETVTSSAGLPIPANQSFVVYGYDDIKNFKGIRSTGSSATMHCQYSRPKQY